LSGSQLARPRIVVVGSVNTDLVVRNARFPAVGETITGGEFLVAGGGKGANQAVAAARLGAHVTLVGRVGGDAFGERAREELAAEGIDLAHLSRDPTRPSGVALILVDGHGDNLISVAPGANAAITEDDIERAAAAIRAAAVLLVQLEVPLPAIRAAARLASAAGVLVVLDPAPVPAGPLPPDLLALVDVVKPNETEAAHLTGLPTGDPAQARRAAAQLREAGPRHAIVTLGARGAVWEGPDGGGHLPAAEACVVDTTAAGDAFAGALAVALARGAPFAQAVDDGCLAGALAATRAGARPGLPTRAELDAFRAQRRRE